MPTSDMTPTQTNNSRDLIVNRRVTIPRAELLFSYSRSSGPGGQNVNKVNTKATLRWNVTASKSLPDDVKRRFLQRFASRLTDNGELVLQSQKTRSQFGNMIDCQERLRQFIQTVMVAPKVRRKSKPSRASKRRRVEAKRRRSSVKRSRSEAKRPSYE